MSLVSPWTRKPPHTTFSCWYFFYLVDDGKIASIYQFPKTYVAVKADLKEFAEIAASTLQQCPGSKLTTLAQSLFSKCKWKSILLHVIVLHENSPKNCPVSSVLLAEARQVIYLENGVIFFSGTQPWTLRTIFQHVRLADLLSSVKLVSSDPIAIAPYISTKAISFCHPIRCLQNHRGERTHS